MASKSTQMDPDLARQLFQEGALLVFLDVPPGTEFGIDYNYWEVGHEFKGVKMIPPGVHFVYYSAVGRDKQVAPRTGFFHCFQAREVLIKEWDRQTEDVKLGPVAAEVQDRVEGNRQQLDQYLGAYPYDTYKKWVSLTSYLRPELLSRLEPLSRRICAVMELHSPSSNTQTRRAAVGRAKTADPDRLPQEYCAPDTRECPAVSTENAPPATARLMESLLPDMKQVAGTEIHFTKIPRKTYPEGATAGDITKYSMDHSYVLQTLLDSVYVDNELDILGEVQFAFICFLIGQVFDGFEQWKQLVRLLCSCDEAMARHSRLFSSFINLLHYHIREIPEDFFVDIVTRDNFLISCLHTFFENLRTNENIDKELKVKGERFLTNLEKHFKWDFSSELEEDAPVIVE